MIQPDVQFVYADLKIVLQSINDQSMINQNRRRKKNGFHGIVHCHDNRTDFVNKFYLYF